MYARVRIRQPGKNVWVYPLDGYSAGDIVAPYIYYSRPAEGVACADPDGYLQIDILDTESVIVPTSIDAYVETNWAYDGVTNTFKSPYDGAGSSFASLTVGTEDGYRIIIDKTSDWNASVAVTVTADDDEGNSLSSSWTFAPDLTAPVVSDTLPSAAWSCSNVLTGFDVTKTTTCSIVQEDTIDAYVDGYWAVRNGVFADAYDGGSSAINAITDGYEVIIDNVAVYDRTPITVDAYGYDAYGNQVWSQWTFAVDLVAPTIDGYYPPAGDTGIDNGTFIYMDITDSEMGMAGESDIDAYVDGSLAYDGTFQSGYDGPLSDCYEITDGYHLRIQTTSDLSNASHTIDAYAEDTCGNSGSETWDFTAAEPAAGSCILHVPMESFGIGSLSNKMTINGSSEWPDVCYFGKDATASNWPSHDSYGGTLNIVGGTGNAPVLDCDLPGTDEHRAVLSNNVDSQAHRYKCTDNTTGNLGTKDFVIEVIHKGIAHSTYYGNDIVFHKRVLSGVYQGLRVLKSRSNGSAAFRFDTGPSEKIVASAGGGWEHILIFSDRDGPNGTKLALYSNGKYRTYNNNMDASNLDNTDYLCIFGVSNGASNSGNYVALIRIWTKASWMAGSGNKDEWDKIVAERYAQVTGTNIDGYDTYCDGYLNTHDRSTSAFSGVLHNGTRKLHYVSPNWPRVEVKDELDDTDAYGLLNESSETNLFIYSQDHSQWTSDGVGVTINNASAPFEEIINYDDTGTSITFASKLEEDATTGLHGVYDGITLTDGSRYIHSIWAKAINQNWLCLSRSGTIDGYFDLANGEVGTLAGCTGGIENWGDDWYRCWISWAESGGGSQNIGVWAASADGTNSYAGGSQDSIYVFGSQIEAKEFGLPSSYIYTSGGTATRNEDRLTIDLTGLNDGYGTIQCQALGLNGTPHSDGYLLSLTDGGSDRFDVFINSNSNAEGVVSESGAVTLSMSEDTEDVMDGYWNSVTGYIRTNRSRMYANGVAGTYDCEGEAVRNANTIELGSDYNGANQSEQLIKDIKVWDGYYKP